MKIINNLDTYSKTKVAVTIGNFDGVHLGHQFLIKRVVEIAKQNGSESLVVTFENHPKTLLQENKPYHSICTLPHKIKLLEELGIDTLFLIPFTKAFADQTAKEFLHHFHKKVPFSHLILGYDAAFGRNREGTPEQVLAYAKEINVEIEYLKPVQINQTPISSSLIKELIRKGDLYKVEPLLGRKYSIYGPIINENMMEVAHLNLPPCGIYEVILECEGKQHKGIIQLSNKTTPRLEIQTKENLKEKLVNVIF